MAEMGLGKGVTAGKLASNVQKKLTRAQEKVMQKLGKADETRDVAFEEGVINFNKQHVEGSKLQRDLRVYLEAVKAMHESSKNLNSCLADMYEPEWYGKDDVDSVVEDSDVLWEDYHQKLVDHALISMDTYLGQFPDIKARIAKRDRKLVDYDSARHAYSSTHKGKKPEGKGGGGVKMPKPASLLERATPVWAQGILSAHNVAQSNLSRNQAEDELERAQKVFEEINIDLQEELPSLWNSRVGFYVSTFQSMAGFEEKFHKEMGKLDQNLYDTLVKLERGETTSRKGGSRSVTSGAAAMRSDRDAANHTLSPGGPPAIPKSPSKLRPTVPPPPKATPCKDMKPENIINLFDAAATPDISVTSPTQFDTPAGGNLLDMDLVSLSAPSKPSPAPQAVSWDSWEPEETPAPEEPQSWDDDGSQPVRASWGDDGTPATPAATVTAQESWDDDGSQPVRADWAEEDRATEAAAAPAATSPPPAQEESWDDDGSRPVKASFGDDGGTSASAQAGWDDGDEEVPQVQEVPQADTPTTAAAAPVDSAPVDSPPAPVATEVTNGAAEAVEMPPGFLFKVQTMHDYAANDSDELEMKAGDVVLVVTFDNPDEQDDGWLQGMKQEDWAKNKDKAAKGVFPENFTSRL